MGRISSESDPSLAESALLSEESLESDFFRAANSFVRGFEGATMALDDVAILLYLVYFAEVVCVDAIEGD